MPIASGESTDLTRVIRKGLLTTSTKERPTRGRSLRSRNCLTSNVKRRRRVSLQESFKIVRDNLAATMGRSDPAEIVAGSTFMAFWWWVTGVPEGTPPPDQPSESN